MLCDATSGPSWSNSWIAKWAITCLKTQMRLENLCPGWVIYDTVGFWISSLPCWPHDIKLTSSRENDPKESDQLERSLTISSWKWHTINSSYSIGHTDQFWYKVGGCYTRLWLSEYGIIWGLSWRLPIILSPYLIYASSINCGSEITQKYVSFCSNSQGYFFILHFSFWVIVWQLGPVLQISSFSNQLFYDILFFIMKYQTLFLVIQSSYLKPSNSFP